MFSKKGRRMKNKRRSGRKLSKRPNFNNFQRVQTMRTIVPDRLRTKMTVVAADIYSFGSSAVFGTHYSGNRVDEPGSGRWSLQPAGFIDWMHFYNNYVCYASNIKLQIVNASEDQLLTAWIAIYPSQGADGLNSGNYIDGASQPYSRKGFVGAITAMDKVTISNGMSTSKIYGFNCFGDDDFSGIVDTGPEREWYWQIACSGTDNDPVFPILKLMVNITFMLNFIIENH